MAASAAGTPNIVPALSGVGDGAGAETPSSAAVAPKFKKATRTITKMVKTLAALKLSIPLLSKFFLECLLTVGKNQDFCFAFKL